MATVGGPHGRCGRSPWLLWEVPIATVVGPLLAAAVVGPLWLLW